MSTEATLMERCQSKCELCASESSLTAYTVSPHSQLTVQHGVVLCDICIDQIENPENTDVNHWRCLNDSMWNQEPAVQVMAWRKLKSLSSEQGWAQDLLDMMYLEDETQKWAEIGQDDDDEKPRDVNGVELKKGDDVTVIKDLPVRGTNQVIKQGTVIRGISLGDDPKLVSGKANGGQSMYVIAEYCRKK
ncbi:PhnA domain-containing protein [Vibrio sonorensis]|uniref:PhnA domain-containing protein n=1 Tax=Vibrio sonorensis TaxID=1004316 RepID=UPI0008DB0E66|nr:PhnA domain-containing protein [Vibrio sonorensis]